MALRLSITESAERDLLDIEVFIAADNEAAALKIILKLDQAMDLLVERPFMGRQVVNPIGNDLRRLTVARYVVFYKFNDTDLLVVRIIHSSRNIDEGEIDT